MFRKLIARLDIFQRKHPSLSIPYAVIKKYADDNGGYQSALITYYGALSLFPLLIVFTTLSQIVLRHNQRLRLEVTGSAARYFPVLGNQLLGSLHSPAQSGISLGVSLLVLLYGARGSAGALQYAASSLWYVPITYRPPFLQNLSRSMAIIVVGGVGFIFASFLSGYSVLSGHQLYLKIVSLLISTVCVWITLIIVLKLAIAGTKSSKDVVVGAGCAAIVLQVLQAMGSILLKYELKKLDSVYGIFALDIGLLFWINLQAQIILYAIEIDVVRFYRLFPRSLQAPITAADRLVYKKYARAEQRHAREKIAATFEP